MGAVFFRLDGAFFRRSNVSQDLDLIVRYFVESVIMIGKIDAVNPEPSRALRTVWHYPLGAFDAQTFQHSAPMGIAGTRSILGTSQFGYNDNGYKSDQLG